jgi:LuxR family maltose regulon positive regulatory protein
LLAEVLLSQGKSVESVTSFAQAYNYAQGYHSPMMAAFIGAAEARFMLRSGQLDRAAEWAMQYEQIESAGYHQDYENITLAHIWLAQGKYDQVAALATQISEGAQANGRIGYVIPAEILRALAHQAAGENNQALASLKLALSLAQPHDFVRLFLDAGQPILKLLHQVSQSNLNSEYAAYLLGIAASSDSTEHPADMLTDREIEVLKLIAEGTSNQEIAVTLVISLGTVKSHIHHIMNKLNARNRIEAVCKARSLHLLPG